MIGHQCLQQRHDRAADDGHAQQARAPAGQRAQTFQRQREDGREHHRVHQAGGQQQPHRRRAAQRDRRADQHHIGRRHQRQHPAGWDVTHDRAAGKAAHHRRAPVQRQVLARLHMVQAGDRGIGHQVDQEAADADLRAHIGKDRHRAQHQMAVRHQAAALAGRQVAGAGLLGGALDLAGVGQAEHRHHQRQHEQRRGQRLVRALHAVTALRRRGGLIGRAQDQHRAQQGAQCRAQRVEGLRQVQPARGRLRPAQQRHIGIGRHLQQRDARGQHEQRAQEQRIGVQALGRTEHQAAHRGDAQPGDDAALVAQALQQPARRHRDQEIGREEAELDQHRLHIAQREHRLQVRDEDVVQRGDQTPHEEQRGQDRQRSGVRLRA